MREIFKKKVKKKFNKKFFLSRINKKQKKIFQIYFPSSRVQSLPQARIRKKISTNDTLMLVCLNRY